MVLIHILYWSLTYMFLSDLRRYQQKENEKPHFKFPFDSELDNC